MQCRLVAQSRVADATKLHYEDPTKSSYLLFESHIALLSAESENDENFTTTTTGLNRTISSRQFRFDRAAAMEG